MTSPKGVFCLESPWGTNGDLRNRSTVLHQLRMLEGAEYCGKVIHHDVVTREEFDFYLKEWLKQKYTIGYPLGYLAFHGAKGALMISKTELSLNDLATVIGPGKAHDRILYFGSCSTMAAPEAELKAFCKKTGAKAIVGYTRPIDWLESASFDCLVVPRLLMMRFTKSVFTSLKKEHPTFVRRLGLRIATATLATPRKIAVEAAA